MDVIDAGLGGTTVTRQCFLIWQCCLIWLASFLLGVSSAMAQGTAGDSDRQAEADLELISALERVVARAIERGEKSVVSIARVSKAAHGETALRDTIPNMRGPLGPADPEFVPSEFATGVVIDREGLVLTNFHVLGDPSENEYWITTHARRVYRMKLEVKGGDERSDLAVLKVDESSGIPDGEFEPITFGDASKLKKGHIVVALGNPYAIARDGQASASWGLIANLSRKAHTPATDDDAYQVPRSREDDAGYDTLHEHGTLIQTDARLNLGTSGGALLNLRGEMIGLTTSRAALAGFEQAAGYAIPVDATFLRVLDALKEGREVEYGLLGIRLETYKPEPKGARVLHVLATSPAAQQDGLYADDVITQIDGRAIHDADELRLSVTRLAPGTATTLTILRKGQTLQKRVVLSKYHVRLKQIVTQRPAVWRGLRVDYPTAVLPARELLERPRGGFAGTCVAVSEKVESGSPADQAGIKLGTLISHVAGTPIETPDDFRRAVAGHTGDVSLTVLYPNETKRVTIKAEAP
jgi:S1-C subfamily serine protease